MKVSETKLPGVLIIEPQTFFDARGFFLETWHKARYFDAGMPSLFVQDNLSFSTRGVIRGLHFQKPRPQGKLVSVLEGDIFDVAVDLRAKSPTFGQWIGVLLSGLNKRQLYIPDGFAHGFCVTSEKALVSYKCTEEYDPIGEGGIRWNDPHLNIDWPVENPNLSDKDSTWPYLEDIPCEHLPEYTGNTHAR